MSLTLGSIKRQNNINLRTRISLAHSTCTTRSVEKRVSYQLRKCRLPLHPVTGCILPSFSVQWWLLDSQNWPTVTYINPAGCNQSSLLLREQVEHTDFSPYTQVVRGPQSAKPSGANCCWFSLLWLNTSELHAVLQSGLHWASKISTRFDI